MKKKIGLALVLAFLIGGCATKPTGEIVPMRYPPVEYNEKLTQDARP